MINVILDNRYFYCAFSVADVKGLTDAQLWRKCQCQNGTDSLQGKGKFDRQIKAARTLCDILSFDRYSTRWSGPWKSTLSLLDSNGDYFYSEFRVNKNPHTSAIEIILE